MIESLTFSAVANYGIFLLLALITLVSAIMVITREEIVHSALYLVLTFFAVAGLYVQLRAQFLAAVQILVYAGGIMVLYLFVILLVNKRLGESARPQTSFKYLAAVIGVTLFLEFVYVFIASGRKIASLISGPQFEGTVENVGVMLYTKYIYQFELVSIVLLVAMVGAIVLSRKL